MTPSTETAVPAPGRDVDGRVHLDLLSVDRGATADAGQGWRYVDESDPAVLARLSAGSAPGCAVDGNGRPPAWRCLGGDVIVDVPGAGRSAHLFVVLFPVPVDGQAGFDEWFAAEHAPLLASAPTWSRARLVALDDGGRPEDGPTVTRMAVHDIQELGALESSERRTAGETAWTREVFAQPWATAVRRHVLVGR